MSEQQAIAIDKRKPTPEMQRSAAVLLERLAKKRFMIAQAGWLEGVSEGEPPTFVLISPEPRVSGARDAFARVRMCLDGIEPAIKIGLQTTQVHARPKKG